jgi:hypothetical protein
MGCHARALDRDAFSKHPPLRRSSSGANPVLGNARVASRCLPPGRAAPAYQSIHDSAQLRPE